MQEQVCQQQQNYHVSGLLLALGGTALFSLKPIVIKLAYASGAGELAAITLLTLRMLFAFPFYFLIAWFLLATKKTTEQKFSPAILSGILLTGFLGYYLAAYLDIWGLQYISAQLERMTLFIYPTIVTVLGFIFFREKITRNIVIAMLLTYLGIAVMYYQESAFSGEHTVKGMILVGLSAVSFAFYMVLSKGYIQRLGSRLFTSLAMLASSIFIFAHFMMSEEVSSLLLSTELYLIIAVVAIPCTVIPSFMISEAIARIGPAKTSITNSSGPMITLIAAVSILGEPFSLIYVLGMGLIMLGVYLLSKREKIA
ncbi:MAG TPA: DMT family transporter [Leucothrix mucor]|nr:DMT family transporter [Leucothrix mucor]